MATDDESDDALLDLLNSTPVVEGTPVDLLAEPERAVELVRRFGGQGVPGEVRELVRARDALQAVVRTGSVGAELEQVLQGVARAPSSVTADGLAWTLTAPADRLPAARAVVAWAELVERRPGRLRPCGNDECRRFLLDRTKGNTARWCSMAACGNRMKARRHYSRTRAAAEARQPDGA